MDSNLKRIFGLDIIRTVAILLVMLSHTTYLIPQAGGYITDFIRLMGATGVDIFFVLSGYLVGGIILKRISRNVNTGSLLNFWMRRWFRTLPNYLVILLINIVLFWVLKGKLPPDFWKYFLFIQNFSNPHPEFFKEAWSLSIEEFAYLILPFFLFLGTWINKGRVAQKMFLYISAVVILLLFFPKAWFALNHQPENYFQWSASFRKVVIYRLDSIYVGFILIYLRTVFNQSFFKHRITFLVVSAVAFAFLHVIIIFKNLNPLNHNLFFSLVYLYGVILCICGVFPFVLKLRAHSPHIKFVIEYVSKRSYALYLVNYSIVLLTLQHFHSASLWLVLWYWILSFIFAELLYLFVERYFLRQRDQRYPRGE